MTTIKIDWDGEDNKDFETILHKLMEIYNIEKVLSHTYTTRHGKHIYLSFRKDITDLDIIIWQMALGSDTRREMFNLDRIKRSELFWNVLFCAKYKNGISISNEKPLKFHIYKWRRGEDYAKAKKRTKSRIDKRHPRG
jgi:hypothetical protein